MSARPGRSLAALAVTLAASAFTFALSAGCVRPTPLERAMSLARQHREAEAVALLRTDLVAKPDDLDARRLLVRLLAIEGDLGSARAEVKALADRLPADDPSPWVELGHALELVHQFEEAMTAYQTAAEASPTSPVGALEAGTRAARWGEWELARTWLEEAVRRGGAGLGPGSNGRPGSASAGTWHTLGLVRLNLHDAPGAREAYRRGAEVDPNDVECRLGLATVALSEHDWTAALSAYDATLRLRPTWGDGQLGRAWALAQLGRREDAARALGRAEELGANPSALGKQRKLLEAELEPRAP